MTCGNPATWKALDMCKPSSTSLAALTSAVEQADNLSTLPFLTSRRWLSEGLSGSVSPWQAKWTMSDAGMRSSTSLAVGPSMSTGA
ncbi:hypothetical protein VTI74DRAFT_8862 [Chaetomium olivicolor]